MANLAATDWTLTVVDRSIQSKNRHCYCRLVIPANTGSSYPSSGGIPLPTTFGMTRNIKYVNIVGFGHTATQASRGVVWQYDKNAHAMQAFWTTYTTAGPGGSTSLVQAPTTFKVSLVYPTGLVMYVNAVGW